MSPIDLQKLKDMLLAGDNARHIAGGTTEPDYTLDVRDQYALFYALQIIGEAATKVSVETKQLLPSLAWDKMIGMRQHLVHGYGDLNLEMVWATVIFNVPPMCAELRRFLSTLNNVT